MHRRDNQGFTLIELMIVVAVIGVLAAVAIPNFISMQVRAREGSTKANMHSMQLAAEDYAVLNDGNYSTDAANVVPLLPAGEAKFINAFTGTKGDGQSWEDRASYAAGPSATPGITSYSDSLGQLYNIKAQGKTTQLNLVLSPGN